MGDVLNIDWRGVFLPSGSIREVVLRGTVMFLALFALLRIVLKRQSGGFYITVVSLIVLIADAAQNGMAGEYRSITEGLILVGMIVFWPFALDWAAYQFRAFDRLLQPPPLVLVEDGRMNQRNMRKELITADELMSALREQGVEDLAAVRRARMEPDGKISVIQKK
jgi:uncharacterized membrane protein YcaP (DUF421 family)